MERKEWIINNAPQLSDKAKEEINLLFPSYIFIRRSIGEIWTSCCGRHEIISKKRTVTSEETNILKAPHCREPEKGWNGGRYEPVYELCPYCGKPGKVKELRYCGRRQNLYSFRRVIAFQWHEGALWGELLNVEKSYLGGGILKESRLCNKPILHSYGFYRFEPGKAEQVTRSYYWWDDSFGIYYYRVQDGPLKGGKWNIDMPFYYTAALGMDYDTVCFEEVQKSPLKYSLPNEKICDTITYLTACCTYPRQIEMLNKQGLECMVEDLVWRGKKNARAFTWGEADPLKAFGLTKPELKEFLSGNKSVKDLEYAKKLKKAGLFDGFGIHDMLGDLRDEEIKDKFIRLCCKHHIKPKKALRWLESQTAKKGKLYDTFQHWADYVDMAGYLNWELKEERVLMPKDLVRYHDNAAEECTLRYEREHNEDVPGYAKKVIGVAKRSAKYNFVLDGFFIRTAENADEIVAEGKMLHHCVGGYAERHMLGALTILFLRKVTGPDKSLYTIEMDGNKLVQIHGYRNDLGKESPRKSMAWLLDKWLEWIKNGSKRDKDGNPIIK